MLIHQEHVRGRREATIQLNWSRERAFSHRQSNWITENVPSDASGVYVIYMREHEHSYSRRRASSIVYFGSGWVRRRILHHLAGPDDKRNPHFERQLENGVPLAFRWAGVAHDSRRRWHEVAESILVYEFEKRYGALPPGNRIRPPNRPAFAYSYIRQHPLDVIDGL